MILYLDASALIKRYVVERGTLELVAVVAAAEFVGSSIISRAETAAAFSKAVRVGALPAPAAALALDQFHQDWPKLIRIQASEPLLARADELAWRLGLRGYDAVHLASALLWQENMEQSLTFATFDRQLWQAAQTSGLTCFPEDLPGMLDSWQKTRAPL